MSRVNTRQDEFEYDGKTHESWRVFTCDVPCAFRQVGRWSYEWGIWQIWISPTTNHVVYIMSHVTHE